MISGMCGCVMIKVSLVLVSALSPGVAQCCHLPRLLAHKIQQHYNLHVYTIRYIYSTQHTVVDIFRSTAVDIYTIYNICSQLALLCSCESDARWMQKQTKGEMVYTMVGPFIT